ncbi:protein of unknown function [Xenorhabdus poinarii G6]|uniref:Serine aminopeptidase S33 domain-containing protein n=1 Tax=Xenorhabdus poinarii G6 TaxID=1354304 RepID=A0A068R887_9GAMM|nr:protein of unknown function [Xenorhabdus poinarii G6]
MCLVDIRGHGNSIGDKGTVSRPAIVWCDVDRIITELKTHFPAIRLHLLGHSSGAGMLINYFTQHKPAHKIDSLVLLAPELGPFATGVHRSNSLGRFADARQWPFMINALSGGVLFGHYPAVQLNFPEDGDEEMGKAVAIVKIKSVRHENYMRLIWIFNLKK